MAERARRVAVYARVSTDGQSVENQLQELATVAERHGWEVVTTFTDEGVSGARGRDGRPGFDALCGAVARREVDLVAAWSVDRLGRSLQDLVGFLGELRAKGVDLYLHVQGLDTSTPAGRAMFGMLGVFAEFERAMIQERVRAGLERARARGRRLGRPPALTHRQRRQLRQDREAGMSLRALARKYGTTAPTVRRVLADHGAREVGR